LALTARKIEEIRGSQQKNGSSIESWVNEARESRLEILQLRDPKGHAVCARVGRDGKLVGMMREAIGN
jgi:hypothetical protein